MGEGTVLDGRLRRDQAGWRAVYGYRRATENLLLVARLANAQAHRRAAAKGGKGKAGRELTQVKQRLSKLADDVLEGKTERGVAAVASQVLNVYLRAVSVELKVKEVMELEERLEELERTAVQRKGDNRWPA